MCFEKKAPNYPAYIGPKGKCFPKFSHSVTQRSLEPLSKGPCLLLEEVVDFGVIQVVVVFQACKIKIFGVRDFHQIVMEGLEGQA